MRDTTSADDLRSTTVLRYGDGMERRQPAQCTGTGISAKRAETPDYVRCIVVTDHPSGYCGFCRKTEGLYEFEGRWVRMVTGA